MTNPHYPHEHPQTLIDDMRCSMERARLAGRVATHCLHVHPSSPAGKLAHVTNVTPAGAPALSLFLVSVRYTPLRSHQGAAVGVLVHLDGLSFDDMIITARWVDGGGETMAERVSIHQLGSLDCPERPLLSETI